MKIQPVSSNTENTQFKGGMAKKIANFINGSKGTQDILRSCSKNPALWFSTASFLVQTTIRPLSIFAITPDKDDAKFGACSSISSAIVEMIGSYAIFKPMNKAIENSSRDLYKSKDTIFSNNSKILRQYKSVTNRFAKIPPTLLTSLLRFSLIGPTALLLAKFGVEKNKKLDTKV